MLCGESATASVMTLYIDCDGNHSRVQDFAHKRETDPAYKELTDFEMQLFADRACKIGLPVNVKEQTTLPQYLDKKCLAVHALCGTTYLTCFCIAKSFQIK